VATNYYLPCSCGNKQEVGARLAGQSIRCDCGLELHVPTLRGLRELEPADSAGENLTAAPAWGLGQGIAFVAGMTLSVGAVVAIVVFLRQMSGLEIAEKPAMENVHYNEDFSTMSPEDSLLAWEFLSSNPLPGSRSTPAFLKYRGEVAKFKNYMAISGALLAVGAVLLSGAILIKPRGNVSRANVPKSNALK